MLFVAGPLQGDCGFEVASVAIGNQVENVCTFSSLAGRAFFSSLASAAVRARKILAKSCEGGSHRAGVPIPLRGCRIGEASHPGPPHTSSQQPSHWVAKLRRDRPTCTKPNAGSALERFRGPKRFPTRCQRTRRLLRLGAASLTILPRRCPYGSR